MISALGISAILTTYKAKNLKYQNEFDCNVFILILIVFQCLALEADCLKRLRCSVIDILC